MNEIPATRPIPAALRLAANQNVVVVSVITERQIEEMSRLSESIRQTLPEIPPVPDLEG